MQNVSIEKSECIEGLVLGRRRHIALDGEVGEEGIDVLGTERSWMHGAVETHVAFDPLPVTLFRATAISFPIWKPAVDRGCINVQLYNRNRCMDIVLDTSAAIAVLLNEPSKPALIKRTEDAELLAPVSLPIEIGNAFSAMFKRNRLTLEQAERAFSMYRQIPVQLVDVDMDASLDLANELNIYAYDAYMLECAQRYRASLLTLDAGLRAAAERVDVKTLEVSG